MFHTGKRYDVPHFPQETITLMVNCQPTEETNLPGDDISQLSGHHFPVLLPTSGTKKC